LQNHAAENLIPEMAKAAKEKRIRFELRKFSKLTKDEMQCVNCDYFGKMGVVSSKLKPWIWNVIVLSCLVAFTIIALHFHEGIGSSRVILGMKLLGLLPILFFAKKNKQFVSGCPSCREHQSDEDSESPSWFKWWKIGMVIALLVIGGTYFYSVQVSKVRAEKLASELKKAEAAKITSDAAIKRAQLYAQQQSPQQIDHPSTGQAQAATPSSDTQSQPDFTSPRNQQSQNTFGINDSSDWRPSGFAAIDDVAAVPNLNERGRTIYRTFLAHPSPRAFLLCQDGRFSTMYVVGDHQDKLRTMLTNRTSGCEPYAINNDVVWSGR
jgi:hypothetical protein